MIAIRKGIPFPSSNNRMNKNGQLRWHTRPTLTGWFGVSSSVGVIILAACLWQNHSRTIQWDVFTAAVLAGGWFAGPIAGSVIGLLPVLLVRFWASPLNERPFNWPANWPGWAFELLFFIFLGTGAGWLGARQRRLQEKIQQIGRELAAGVRAGTEDLENANAALKADILKQKQTEAALRRSEAYLAEAERLSHTGSWAYDIATGVPVYWSLERCRISRFDPVKGHPTLEEYRRLHSPEDWEKLMEAFQRAIRDKTDFETDSREVLADGTTRHLHIVGHPVLNAAGEVVELVGSTMDMTERKQTEEALQKAQAHLTHMAHLTMMGELAASIAHEVNQPLAAVVANADVCLRWLDRESPDLDEAREAVRRIIRDGNRGSDVISRIRALKKEPPSSLRLNVNDVIQEIITLSKTNLRGVTLRMELMDELPLVSADRTHLQQVLLNLITNAIDAMKSVTERPRALCIQTQVSAQRTVIGDDSGFGCGCGSPTRSTIIRAVLHHQTQGIGHGPRHQSLNRRSTRGKIVGRARSRPGRDLSVYLAG